MLALLYHSIEPLVFVKVVGPIVQVIVVCKGMIAIQAQLLPDFLLNQKRVLNLLSQYEIKIQMLRYKNM